MELLRRILTVTRKAYDAFVMDDGWAIASHIALSALMALFPFLIVVTSFAAFFFGSKELADGVAELLLNTWPDAVAQPIANELHRVLTTTRGDILTFGAVAALYFATSGVESLRIGLNRAYNVTETRSWWLLRLESVAYIVVAAIMSLVLAFLIVLGPVLIAAAKRYLPGLEEIEGNFATTRYVVTTVALIASLIIVHKWLPAGRRRIRAILPGIVTTIAGSLIAGVIFGEYLVRFPENYVTYYAGLASPMIALVFLYFVSAIFIYGGEINAILMEMAELAADEATTA